MALVEKFGFIEIWHSAHTDEYYVFGVTKSGDPLVYPSRSMALEVATSSLFYRSSVLPAEFMTELHRQQQLNLAFHYAFELAESGNYSNYVNIEDALRTEYPKISDWLIFYRDDIDAMCQHAQERARQPWVDQSIA